MDKNIFFHRQYCVAGNSTCQDYPVKRASRKRSFKRPSVRGDKFIREAFCAIIRVISVETFSSCSIARQQTCQCSSADLTAQISVLLNIPLPSASIAELTTELFRFFMLSQFASQNIAIQDSSSSPFSVPSS